LNGAHPEKAWIKKRLFRIAGVEDGKAAQIKT